jgi:cytochrome c-type biogenesis protein CcmF
MNFNAGVFCAVLFLLFAFAAICGLSALRLSERVSKIVLAAGRGAVQTAAILSVILLGFLIYAFIADHFSLKAVAEYSSKNLAPGYKISAAWAGASGSLLVWSVILFVLMAVWTNKAKDTPSDTTALAIGSIMCAGFAAFLMFVAKPFALLTAVPDDGAGLNPLLQNFWMVIHPPLLFAGYSGFLIPFVLMVSGALAGEPADAEFYLKIRRWLLFAFCFLTLGIATGAKWAYVVLGWGGFWGWDPVENASLLPWLVALAALHSLAISRRTGKFRIWTMALVAAPFLLCLVATFITRSGALQSVHAFGANPMGTALLIMIGFVCGLWLVAIITAGIRTAAPAPAGAGWFVPGLSFVTEMILVFAAIAVAVGTFWPILSRIFSGESFSPDRSFYDKVCSVAGIALVALVIVCSIENWSRNSRVKALGVVMAHLGLILLAVAAGVGAFGEKEVQLHIAKGMTQKAGGYEFTYMKFKHDQIREPFRVGPEVVLKKDSAKTTLWPHRNMYADGQTTTEVAVHSGLLKDVYIIFDGLDENDKVILAVLFKPMMTWLWFAMLLIILGAAWMWFD